MASNVVWTSDMVEDTKEKLKFGMGNKVDMSCFHDRDIELRAGNILFNISEDEIAEFNKCSNDISYFVENYCRFLTDKGRTLVDLRPYQSEILDELGEEEWKESLQELGPKNRNYILMASRQTGKTTTIAAYFAWYLCFHTDRNLAILANKEKTAFEIVSKVMDVFKGLPFFLKPGIIQAGAGGMKLDNGCQLMCQATTKTASIGFTIHVLYADEFAHIPENIVRAFWRSVYPTLSSSVISQCIITSTPAGQGNLFFEIWDKSVRGLNSFKHKRVDYWEVPSHDDKWAAEMKRDFGEDEFAQEFELQFNVDSKLLLNAKLSSFLKRIETKYEYHDLDNTDLDEDLYENLTWKKGFDPNSGFDPNKELFIISVDTGEGKDQDELKDNDYNVLSIYRAKIKSLAKLRALRSDEYFVQNMFRLEQVGLYRDNFKDEEICAKVARSVIFDQLGGEACLLLLEMNFNGKLFLKVFSEHDDYFEDVVLNTYHNKPVPGEKPPRKKPGFKVNADKPHYCKAGKRLMDAKTIVPNEPYTLLEFNSFGKNKKGQYKGIGAHDDTVMATLNIARLYEESTFFDKLYDIFDELPKSPEKDLAAYYLERPTDNKDISDNMFESMYSQQPDMSNVENIFKAGEKQYAKYITGRGYGLRKR